LPEKGTPSDTYILHDIIAVLEYYRAMGIEKIPFAVSPKMSPVNETATNIPAAVLSNNSVGEAQITFPVAQHAPQEKANLLSDLRNEIGDCKRCKLSRKRMNIVFGEGNPDARLMFIGEGPGEEEDVQGRPFAGKAGTLLTRLVEKMDLRREDVYIANIVKCRPPENREPEQDEVASCRGFVERQIDIISPRVIMTLGNVALQTLMNDNKLKITASRGKFIDFRGFPVMPTFHPAYLLRNPSDKWKTWADAQKALEKLHVRS
jgi:DNA polymerase